MSNHCDLRDETVANLHVCGDAVVRGDLKVRGTILPLRTVEVGLRQDQGGFVSGVNRSVVNFDNVITRNRLDFDVVGHRFVAPRDGTYSFSTIVTWGVAVGSTPRAVGLQRNGEDVHITINTSYDGAASSSSDSAVFTLKKDDVVQVVAGQQSGLPDPLAIGVVSTLLIITQLR
jgi:hypothetical protein